MRRIVICVVILLALANVARGQEVHRIIPCATPIPADLRSYHRWEPDGVAVRPVIPELRTAADPLTEIHKSVVGRSAGTTPEEQEHYARNQARLKKLTVLQVYTPPETLASDVSAAPPSMVWAELEKATVPENMEVVVLPCNKTVVQHPSSADPDTVVNGQVQVNVNVGRNPVLVSWAEEGITTPEGEPGFRVARTKSLIPITQGPHEGEVFRFACILACGNPDWRFEVVPEEPTVVVGDMPPTPTHGDIVVEKNCEDPDYIWVPCPEGMKPQLHLFPGEGLMGKKLPFKFKPWTRSEGTLTTTNHVPMATYTIQEEPIKGWIAEYFSQTFSVEPGETTTIWLTNRQVRPPEKPVKTHHDRENLTVGPRPPVNHWIPCWKPKKQIPLCAAPLLFLIPKGRPDAMPGKGTGSDPRNPGGSTP